MTIVDFKWRQDLNKVIDRLAAAHKNLTNIAVILRDSSGAEVWTEAPTDSTRVAVGMGVYSLEGWRVHFGGERSSINGFDQANSAGVTSFDPDTKAAIDGYLVSTATIGSQLAAIRANYVDGRGNLVQEKLSQADRNALATVIESELA